MKKIIIFLMLSFLFMAMAKLTYAHTLKIDGNIGVNLHIDPDDAPVSGSESKFLMDIQDKSGRFNPNNPANCTCTVKIYKKEELLKTLSVATGGIYNQLRFTFPSTGIYTVVVEGAPKGEGVAFQTFKTTFEYFVKAGGSEMSTVMTSANPLRDYAPYIALVVGLLVIVMFVL
jgi:hypothetical protein